MDIIVCDPFGLFMFNERLIESYIIARKRCLKPEGMLFPNSVDFCCAPFSDEMLYKEAVKSAETFWNQKQFHGLDLTGLLQFAIKEKLSQPIIDTYDPKNNLAQEEAMFLDLKKLELNDVREISHKFVFTIYRDGIIHGIAFWFKAYFNGCSKRLTLNSGPGYAITRWYQTRLLISQPLAVLKGQRVHAYLNMEANNLMSYQIKLKVKIKDIEVCQLISFALKNYHMTLESRITKEFTQQINKD